MTDKDKKLHEGVGEIVVNLWHETTKFMGDHEKTNENIELLDNIFKDGIIKIIDFVKEELEKEEK